MTPQKNFLFPPLKSETRPSLHLENKYRDLGFHRVAGLDEAGRGPLAGPVVAAAVVLPPRIPSQSRLHHVRDSKALRPAEREELYEVILAEAEDVAWAACEPEEIDQLNILAASLEAMCRAVRELQSPPQLCLVDGNHRIPLRLPSVPVVKGDRICLSIAAASVVAKVARDRIMEELHRRYPSYGFHLHKGYATPEHQAALLKFGPCPAHRKTFRGVSETRKNGRPPE